MLTNGGHTEEARDPRPASDQSLPQGDTKEGEKTSMPPQASSKSASTEAKSHG
jgi:hypothetical protein